MSSFTDNTAPSRFALHTEVKPDRTKIRNKLAADEAAYLASGKKITVIPTGVSAYVPSAYFVINGKQDLLIKMSNRPHPSTKRKAK